MTDTIATEIAEEQRAEWTALHDEIRKLDEAHRNMQQEAGATLSWHLRTPGSSREYALERALEEAQQAADLWAERTRLYEQAQVHPYTAVVRARIAERKAEQVAR